MRRAECHQAVPAIAIDSLAYSTVAWFYQPVEPPMDGMSPKPQSDPSMARPSRVSGAIMRNERAKLLTTAAIDSQRIIPSLSLLPVAGLR